MRQGLVAALFWLVQSTGYMTDYTGPFATREVCEAARREAAMFGGLGADCVTVERYDDYLIWIREYYERMGDGGYGT